MCSIKLASIHHLDHLEEQKRVERESFMANRVATQGCTEHRRAQTTQTVSQSGHDTDVHGTQKNGLFIRSQSSVNVL